MDRAVFGEAIALTAQLFQFLRAQRLAQQFVGVAGGVEAGADMRLQHQRLHAVAAQHVGKGLHGRAIERGGAEDQRVRAGLPGLLQNAGDGFLRHVAVEQRRAERAVGIGADQSGQRDLVGAPHRDHRHQADQAGCIAPRAERVGVGAAPRRSVHRQFPFGQIIAVRLGGALDSARHWARGNAGERRQRPAGAWRMRVRILARCTTDRRCVGNISHFPESPFAIYVADGAMRAPPGHRVHGATLAERDGKYRCAKLGFERSR